MMNEYADQRAHDVAWMTASEREALAEVTTSSWTSAYHRVSDDSVSSFDGHSAEDLALAEACKNICDPDIDHVWVRNPTAEVTYDLVRRSELSRSDHGRRLHY